MTTAWPSATAACQTRAAGVTTGRASGRQRFIAATPVKAMIATRPSLPTSVGSAISLSFSAPVSWS